MNIPIELIYIIYKYSDISTRIKLNRIFKISYYILNPFNNEQIKGHKMQSSKDDTPNITFVIRGH
jgi:hypothetical protein